MSYGVQFASNNGYVTIDSRFFNTALISTGTVTGMGVVDIPTPQGCTVAIRPNVPAYSQYIYNGASMITRVRVGPNRNASDISLSVEYFVFGPPTMATPKGEYGVQVCREDGVPVFDSRLKYMMVAKFEPPSNSYPEKRPDSEASIGYGSMLVHTSRLIANNKYRTVSFNGRKLACIVVTARYTSVPTWPWGPPDPAATTQDFVTDVEVECVMASGNDLRLYNVTYAISNMNYPSSVVPPVIGRSGSGSIIVDVTGY